MLRSSQRRLVALVATLSLLVVVPLCAEDAEGKKETSTTARLEQFKQLWKEKKLDKAFVLGKVVVTDLRETHARRKTTASGLALAVQLADLADVGHRLHRDDEAQEFFDQSIAEVTRLFPAETPKESASVVADIYLRIGTFETQVGRNEAARRNLETAMDCYAAIAGAQAKLFVCRLELAYANANLGRLVLAAEHCDLAFKLLEELPKEHQGKSRERAISLRAVVRFKQGNFQAARDDFAQLLVMHEQGQSPAAIQTAINLAGTYAELGRESKAIESYERALELSIAIKGQRAIEAGTLESARVHRRLGQLLSRVGRFESSQRHLLAAKRQFDAVYESSPRNREQISVSLNSNLGSLKLRQGRYEEARKLLSDSLSRRIKLFADFPTRRMAIDIANCNANLSRIYGVVGDWRLASQFSEKSVATQRLLFPSERYPNGSLELAASLRTLATAYRKTGRQQQAKQLYEQVLQMRLGLLPADHEAVVNARISLAALAFDVNDLKAAARISGEVRKQLEAAKRRDDAYLLCLQLLGLIHQRAGDHPAAVASFEKIVALLETRHGQDGSKVHPDVAFFLGHLAQARFANGDVDAARQAGSRALAVEERMNANRPVTVTDRQLTAISGRDGALNKILSIPAGVLDDGDVFEQVWYQRGRLFQTASLRGVFARKADASVRDQYAEYLDVRSQLSRLAWQTNSPATADKIRSLVESKERHERALFENMPDLEERTKPFSAKTAALKASMPSDAAYVHFCEYMHRGPKGEDLRGYTIFLLLRDAPLVRKSLDVTGNDVRTLIKEWRQAIRNGMASKAPAELAKQIWEPVATSIPGDIRRVYLCADGPLHELPWAALPGEDQQPLLTRFEIAAVPCGQFLLRQLQNDRRAANTVLAVGDVDYGSDETNVWKPLPGTKQEVANLRSAFRGATTALTQQAATRSRVLQRLASVDYAHLATHGFYADSFRAPRSLGEATLFQGDAAVAHSNPYLLAGLVLAAEGSAAANSNGVVTGEEIASLDLERLQLAVLSACDSSRGRVEAGTGVFGLQQAFHVAGSRNVVASLWRVDDRSTAALMKLFYFHLLKKQQPPISALRAAQLTLYRDPDLIEKVSGFRGPDLSRVIRGGRPRAKTTTPARYWAAFQLSGPGF